MLCEVIAYILSRQRLSAKTFVTGCVFYALQDRLSLWMLCDTSGVGGFPLHFSTSSPFGHHPRLRMVCPLWGQWVRAGRFLFSLPLHFSTGSPFGHHPRLRIVCPPLGTVGKRTRSSPYTSSRGVENLYTICGHTPSMSPFQRRNRTRQLIASGGGAPCLTAGDTRA